ncbi:MAG: HAD family acid phosphatase [Balneolaceae bacterium]|nr:HAD family acid phosphatase [Balneolaceae bacterium]
MKFKFLFLSILTITALLTGCATTQPEITNNNFNSTLWVQTAAEYEANAIQAYNSAESNIGVALRDKSWTAALEQGSNYSLKPPAIILDIDETVLDNSKYQAQLVLDDEEFNPETWDEWVAMEAATAVPGAVDFINSMADLQVDVIYITNRECMARSEGGPECPQEQDTIDNLLKVGINEVDAEHLMLRGEQPGWTSEKESRREEVASNHRIIMLFGDDLGDFLPDVKSNITPEERAELVDEYSEHWGRKWFILGNPTYGSWESILNDPKSNYLRDY